MASTKSRILLAAATAALVALPTSAFALESFTPGEDPCLGDPAAAPYVDRDEVREPHLKAVDCTFDNGVMVGEPTSPLSAVTGERVFNPGESVSRGQLATIIVNSLEHAGYTLPDNAPDAFTDDDGTVHEASIDAVAAIGVMQGTSDTTFAPQAPVTRAQLATIIAAAYEAMLGEPLPAGPDAFRDDDGSVHEPNINAAAAAGLASGRSATTFEPAWAVTRAQGASFLTRLLDAWYVDYRS